MGLERRKRYMGEFLEVIDYVFGEEIKVNIQRKNENNFRVFRLGCC